MYTLYIKLKSSPGNAVKYFPRRNKDFPHMQIESLNIFIITKLLTPDEHFEALVLVMLI